MEDQFKFTAEVIDDAGEIKPIELGGGLIEYRKYAWALKFLEEKKAKLEEYRNQITIDVDKAIAGKQSTIDHLRKEIERAMLADPDVDQTATGGKTLQMPDIATISISKLSEKVEIVDPEAVLNELGQEFSKVKVSLDVTKAKKHILESGKLPTGAEKKESRTLSIRFTK